MTDSEAIRALTARDRALGSIVARHGAPPRWARRPGFATLIRIVLEQQVSLTSGAAAYRRLQRAVGRVTPASVADAGAARLRAAGITRQKTGFCCGLAASVADGTLDLRGLARLPDDAVRSALVAHRGIGPWTADVYLIMALGRPDVWPNGDLALAKSMQIVDGLDRRPDRAEQAAIATRWAPYRATAARLLWHLYLSRDPCPRTRSEATPPCTAPA